MPILGCRDPDTELYLDGVGTGSPAQSVAHTHPEWGTRVDASCCWTAEPSVCASLVHAVIPLPEPAPSLALVLGALLLGGLLRCRTR